MAQPEHDDELDEKLKLIQFSYGEVLDATKHQDDKIGRMITSVAFLTAATLALAALGSAQFITRRFFVSPYYLPLGLITLIMFILGVVFTVLLLLASLATPLRVPGLGDSSQKQKRAQQALNDAPTSQLYFYSISGDSLQEWEHKWHAPSKDLKAERLAAFVREVHNLGVRTTFKYDRGTEAVSALSFSLLALGLAAIFIAIAAGTDGADPVVLDPLHRLLIGFLLGAYSALQLLTRIRYERQEVDDVMPAGHTRPKLVKVPRASEPSWRTRTLLPHVEHADLTIRWLGRSLVDAFADPRTFALLFGTFVMVSVLSDQGWPEEPGWVTTEMALDIAAIISFFAASRSMTKAVVGESVLSRLRRELWARLIANQLTIPFSAIIVGVAVVWFASYGWYGPQLLCAVGLVFVMNMVQAMVPMLALAARRKKYQARLAGFSTDPDSKAGGRSL